MLENLLSKSNLFAFALNKDRKIVECTESLSSIINVPKEKIINNDLLAIIAEEYKEYIASIFENFKKGFELKHCVIFKLINVDNYICRLILTPLEDNEKFIVAIGSLLDAKLIAYPINFADIVDYIKQIILRVNHQGRICYINQWALGYLGYSLEEIIGQKLDNFIKGIDNILNLQDSNSSDVSISNEWSIEQELVKKNGERLWINWNILPYKDNQGKVLEYIFIGYNLTSHHLLEETLKKDKQLLRNYLNVSGTIILCLDKEGNINLINKYGANLLGYDCEQELLGKNWFSNFLPEEIREEIKQVFYGLLHKNKEDKAYEYKENEILCFNNQRRLIAWHNAPLYNEHGEVVGVLSSGNDITELRKVQEQLDIYYQSMRNILEKIPVGVYLVNREGDIEFANPSMARISGLSLEDFLKLNIYNIPAYKELGITNKVKEVIDNKATFVIKDIKYISSYARKQTWRNFILMPFKVQEQIKALVVVEDISEYKEIENKLSYVQQIFEKATTIAKVWVWEVDQQGNYLYSNRICEHFTGRIPEDLIGRMNIFNFLPDDNIAEEIKKAMGNHENINIVLQLEKKDGYRITVERIASPFYGPEGDFLGYRGIDLDITEKVITEQELIRSENNMRKIIEMSQDAILVVSSDKKIQFLNNAAEKLFQKPKEELINTDFNFESQIEDNEEMKIMLPDGSVKVVQTYLADIEWENQLMTLVSLHDITDIVNLRKKLEKMAVYDGLTGLYNRNGFFMIMDHQLKIAQRNKRGGYLVFIDMDNLKVINDNFGHKEGDNALQVLASLLRNNFRKSDIIARLGGDEFVVFAVEARNDSAEVFINRLNQMLTEYNKNSGKEYNIEISLGNVYYDPYQECSIDDLITKADQKMYENKKKKRQFYN